MQSSNRYAKCYSSVVILCSQKVLVVIEITLLFFHKADVHCLNQWFLYHLHFIGNKIETIVLNNKYTLHIPTKCVVFSYEMGSASINRFSPVKGACLK